MSADAARPRSFQVLLVGGASGTGKTGVASRLANHFAIGTSAVDDFQVILEQMTTPEQQPVIHFWRTSDPDALSAEEIMIQGVEVARVMRIALEAVIADHLKSRQPVVLEGDFIPPALAAQTSFASEANNGRVRSVFIYEADEKQIIRNLWEREPEAGEQVKRAKVSWLQGQWLAQECDRWGVPAILARPWETLFERVLEALE